MGKKEREAVASIVCQGSEWHLVDLKVIRPEFDREGEVVGGYLGSGKDFCEVCDSPAELLWVRAI